MKSRIYFWKKKHAKYAQEHNGHKNENREIKRDCKKIGFLGERI
jgi:hypothetical protein